MYDNQEWEEKYQEYQRKEKELEEKWTKNRRRSRTADQDEEIYWDIRRKTREIYSSLFTCWKSPEYYRCLDEEEDDMQDVLKSIETEIGETREYLEKERGQLSREERECENELRKLNLERENGQWD